MHFSYLARIRLMLTIIGNQNLVVLQSECSGRMYYQGHISFHKIQMLKDHSWQYEFVTPLFNFILSNKNNSQKLFCFFPYHDLRCNFSIICFILGFTFTQKKVLLKESVFFFAWILTVKIICNIKKFWKLYFLLWSATCS